MADTSNGHEGGLPPDPDARARAHAAHRPAWPGRGAVGADPLAEAAAARRRARWIVAVRGMVLLLSAGGMLATGGLWAFGHGALGLRVLAGDILVLLAILLLV